MREMTEKEIDRMLNVKEEIKDLTIRELSHLWDKDDDGRARRLFDGGLYEMIRKQEKNAETGDRPTIEATINVLEDALSEIDSARRQLEHMLFKANKRRAK
jgi:hypothetical protein